MFDYALQELQNVVALHSGQVEFVLVVELFDGERLDVSVNFGFRLDGCVADNVDFFFFLSHGARPNGAISRSEREGRSREGLVG